MDVQALIHEQVTGNPVVLYMKGTPQFPQCGFGARRADPQGLRHQQVLQRQRAREPGHPRRHQGLWPANWPTIPRFSSGASSSAVPDIADRDVPVGRTATLLDGLADAA